MDPQVQKRFGQILRKAALQPRRALEVGGRTNQNSLLRFPLLADAERVCVNLEPVKSRHGIQAIKANANAMDMFDDDSFDLVMSNAMLEHDPFFWLSLAEMRRVLKPGGLLIVGVPGFTRNKRFRPTGLPPESTLTMQIHTKMDLYRFTPMAVREVFFAGFDNVKVKPLLAPPRVVGHGRKPLAAAA